ncbi:MAG: hypothetical protein IT486_10505 [Gammaproteobacteria bacterium]|nr:hypothetical protein [Gammaproteobacteria bacterium]
MRTRPAGWLTTFTVALLAGCGGGGGGSNFSSTPAQAVAITQANAADVTSTTLTAVDGAAWLSDFGLYLAFGLIAPLDEAAMMASAAGNGSGPGARLVETATLECLVAGDVVITSDIETAGTLTPNDTIELDFDNCNDGDGVIIDGELDLRVEVFSGDLGSGFFLLETETTLDRLLLTADGESLRLDGEVELDMDTRADDLLAVAVAGSSLDVVVNGEASTLTDFQLTVDSDITNPDDWVYTKAGSGTLTAEALGSSQADGKVTFETIDPLVERDSAEFPLEGQFEILGANNSSVLVSDTADDEVYLDVDADGNGQYEATITTTWTALLP